VESTHARPADIDKLIGELESLGEIYVDQDACPFECRSTGDWTVLEEMMLK
jgi:hypothetical protein